jgi:predicted alpha/beta hydrolase
LSPRWGTGQGYYAPLAKWLASRGFLVATFDYSGTGRSRLSDIRRLSINLIDWGRFDCSSMVEVLSRRLPGAPFYWPGHSMGGQLLAFVSQREPITRAVHIATGSGYWKENSQALRWKVWWLWYAMAPISLRLLGYYPGHRLRTDRQRVCLTGALFKGSHAINPRWSRVTISDWAAKQCCPSYMGLSGSIKARLMSCTWMWRTA